MKKIKAEVYTDCDFPNYLFIKIGNDTKVAKVLTKWIMKSRGIESVSIHDRNGRTKTLSTARIETAIEMGRDVLDIRYIPKNKCFRVQKDALLLGLIKAKKELQEENPKIPLDEFIDDAYIKIIKSGYIPTDYDDLKHLILKNVMAVKIERERRRTEYDDNRRHDDNDDND